MKNPNIGSVLSTNQTVPVEGLGASCYTLSFPEETEWTTSASPTGRIIG